MRATFKLINSYFWKTIYGPILAFIFPIMLLGILGNIMRIEYVYPGIIALTMLFLGVLALPLAIMELKGSSLFKYIGSSPVNPLKFSIVIIFYYILISVLTGILIMVSTIIIFYKNVFPNGSEFKKGILSGLTTIQGFLSFYVASFLHLLLVIATGLAIATFSKTPQQALSFAIIVIIPTMFLSGMVVTVDVIARSQTMQWISRFIPFRYSTGNLVVATTPINQLGDIFSKLSISEKQIIFGNGGIIIDKKDSNYGSVQIQIANETLEKQEWGNYDKPTNIWKGKYLRSSKDIQNFIISYISKNTKIDIKNLFNIALKKDGGDFMLFKSILLNPNALNNSDNNIFKLDQSWSVRKILVPSAIKEFMQDYFRGGNKSGKTFDIARYEVIIDKISTGDLQFVDMFTKQSLELYTIPERSLNLFLPIVFIGLLGVYINKKFTWSSR